MVGWSSKLHSLFLAVAVVNIAEAPARRVLCNYRQVVLVNLNDVIRSYSV